MKTRQTTIAAAALCMLIGVPLAASASPSLNLPLGQKTSATAQQAPVGPVPKVVASTPPGLGAPTSAPPAPAPAPATKPAFAAPQPPVASAPVQVAKASTTTLVAAQEPAKTVASVAAQEPAKTVAPQPGVDRAPSLGDWEDLYQRKAYQAQLATLKGSESTVAPQGAQQAMLPPLPPPNQQGIAQLGDAPEKKTNRRFSAACPDDNKPCFFSVYGVHVDGGENNFRGQLAINGRVISVYKGKKFEGYTITDVSDSALTATKGRARYVWPLYAQGDFEADPRPLEAARPQAPTPGFPVIPNNPYMR
ncbi:MULTISPECIES: hypothetical protein [Burkholderia]|jgi:hypothetical protein|uniref:Lipoprotein n=3 Tax=Bacteria TaxID=2 RepID=A0AAP1YGX8_9BURK|nr:hypothetical protein [Burkholderia contaminans]ELK7724805.1 hypothetical protein [Burkholderia cenocepacia]UTP27769.1 hypothetical protein NMB33_40495 [Burkholderia sp. FXe9]HBN6128498.1 hypothetical protein [Clostridioides difficile]MBH9693734.1 hypothetical protein [Burkholderia contaminans]MBK1905491.1 hypothetical protein [Burkholderia contaminans]